MKALLALLPALLLLSARAQSMDGAVLKLSADAVSLSLDYQNWDRKITAGGFDGELNLRRLLLRVSLPLAEGWFADAALGHDDFGTRDFAGDNGLGWSLGTHARLVQWTLRDNPNLGPREWLAIVAGLALDGGSTDGDSQSADWLALSGELSLEYVEYFSLPTSPHSYLDALRLQAGFRFQELDVDAGDLHAEGLNSTAGFVRLRLDLANDVFFALSGEYFTGSDRSYGVQLGWEF